jgi:hypothetical protein
MAQSVQKIVSCLTDQEQTTLLALLRKIASALAEDKIRKMDNDSRLAEGH